jgi:MYXO-CTERM domain-containing protein
MRNIGLGFLVFSATMMVVGCSADSSASSNDSDNAAVKVAWNVETHPQLATRVMFAKPASEAKVVLGGDVDKASLAFLHANRDALKLNSPMTELVHRRVSIDELSMTHVHFSQVERGVPVIGGELAIHYQADGTVSSVNPHYVSGLDTMDLSPTVTVDAAKAAAAASLKVDLTFKSEQLVIRAADGQPVALAWELLAKKNASFHSWTVYVDAKTGLVLRTLDNIKHLTGAGADVDGKVTPVNYTSQNGQNVMVDTTRPAVINLLDAKLGEDPTQGTIITSTAPTTTWDATASLGKGSAVNAQLLVGAATDFYTKALARKGWDDKNQAMNIYVHVGENGGAMENAFYDPQDDLLAIGDGGDNFKPFAVAYDVVAHEYSHAITGHTSALAGDGQPMALNESFSDVLGNIVEHSIKPDPLNNWHLGETLNKDGSWDRNMIDPHTSNSPQPAHMTEFIQTTEDNGGCHDNDGIPNHAAYLATMGGTNSVSKIKVAGGIGWDKLAQVWYRANTQYLQPNSTFADMAKATLQSAADLKLSEADTDTIDCAWKAVGVTQGDCKVAPQSTTPTTDPTTPGDSSSSKAKSGSDDSSSGDDDDDSTSSSSSKKKSSAKTAATKGSAPAAAGCNTTGNTGAPTSALFGLLGVALLLGRRRRS